MKPAKYKTAEEEKKYQPAKKKTDGGNNFTLQANRN
jgi:hypothetical protein